MLPLLALSLDGPTPLLLTLVCGIRDVVTGRDSPLDECSYWGYKIHRRTRSQRIDALPSRL